MDDVERALPLEVVKRKNLPRVLADRDQVAVHGQRCERTSEPKPREPRVEVQRITLAVEIAENDQRAIQRSLADHDLLEMLHPTGPLDDDPVMAIDHDFLNGRIVKVRPDRREILV